MEKSVMHISGAFKQTSLETKTLLVWELATLPLMLDGDKAAVLLTYDPYCWRNVSAVFILSRNYNLVLKNSA